MMSSPMPIIHIPPSHSLSASSSPRQSSSPLETEVFFKTMESLHKSRVEIDSIRSQAKKHANMAKNLYEHAMAKEEELDAKWHVFRSDVEISEYDSAETATTDSSYDSRESRESPQRDLSPTRRRSSSISQARFSQKERLTPQLTVEYESKKLQETLQKQLSEGVDPAKINEIELMIKRLHNLEETLAKLKTEEKLTKLKTDDNQTIDFTNGAETIKREILFLKDTIALRKVNLGIY